MYKQTPTDVLDYIGLSIAKLVDYIGVSNKFTPEKIEVLSDDILSEHGRLTIADVNIVLKRARTGYYGEIYNSINPIKIMGWFKEYWNERMETAAKMSQQEHSRTKGGSGYYTQSQTLRDKLTKK